MVGELVPGPFMNSQNYTYLLFLLYLKVKIYQNKLKKSADRWLRPYMELFKKQKEVWN